MADPVELPVVSAVGDALPRFHSRRMTSIPSTSRLTRSAIGTPKTANSSARYPSPTPSRNRPPLITSRKAPTSASSTGLCSGKQHDVRAQPHPVGLGREALQERQEREVVKARRNVVLAAPDGVEPELPDEAHLLDRLGKAARGVVPRRVLRVEVDSEFHPALLDFASRPGSIRPTRPPSRAIGYTQFDGRARWLSSGGPHLVRAALPAGADDPQALGWPAIAAGENTLIAAPTGSGKTLAAFLVCIDRLYRAAGAEPAGEP